MAEDYSSALLDGPWTHQFLAANGTRLHFAAAGPVSSRSGALVVLLHDAGQFWWAWRGQLPAIAAAGHPVIALDLRGVGASDKPPEGYDVPNRTRDVAGVIRSLGYERAVVVGHGTGGEVAWAMAALQPGVTCAVAAFAAPHPARVHASLGALTTAAARRFLALVQVPMVPERRLRDGALLAEVFGRGVATEFSAADLEVYQTAIRISFAAHTSCEPLRWSMRSRVRADGHRYRTAVRQRVDVPALQVTGARDGFLRPDAVGLDAAAFTSNLRSEVVDDVGHYLPEEAPEQVNELLLNWLAGLEI